eukprot:10480291-Alexandrium_andersonii.AAC.1
MFLTDVGNMFNDQAISVTFLEKFRSTSNAEQAWGRKKQLMQWTINGLGQATYDATKFEFIPGMQEGRWSNYHSYEVCSSFFREAQK